MVRRVKESMTKDNREAAAFIVYRALDLTCLYIPGAASHGPCRV